MATQVEAWSETSAELTAAQAHHVAQSGLVNVLVDEPPARWRLVADSRVGVVWFPDWEVRVVPRIAIPKLMFLLGYASDPRGWRDIGPAFDIEDDLFAAIASGFAAHAQRALAPGPIRGYVSIEDQGLTLRGRLRVADQIARWPALPIPLELAYDDYSADVAENRLIRGATELLLRLPLIPASARKRLLQVRAILEDVAPTPPGTAVQAPPITRLNSRYRAALALGELILRSASISTTQGRVKSVAFVFDMNVVFEDFLSAALGSSLERYGGHLRLQHGREHLDLQRRIQLIPDITWWKGGRCLAVIDAKYKPLAQAGFPNADAYQMLAYSTALGLDRGYLVYARDAGEENRVYEIRNAPTVIDVKAIDVERLPEAVLDQVDELAARIAGG